MSGEFAKNVKSGTLYDLRNCIGYYAVLNNLGNIGINESKKMSPILINRCICIPLGPRRFSVYEQYLIHCMEYIYIQHNVLVRLLNLGTHDIMIQMYMISLNERVQIVVLL